MLDLDAHVIGLCGAAGRITHHDEVARLKRVYELVQEAKQQVSGECAAAACRL